MSKGILSMWGLRLAAHLHGVRWVWVGLAVVGLATLIGGAAAQSVSPTPGRVSVNFTVMNLAPEQVCDVNLRYVGTDGQVDAVRDVEVEARSSYGFEALSGGISDGWEGSALMSASCPAVGFGQMLWEDGSSTDGKTAGAYNAFEEGATLSFLPSLAARQAQYSRLIVQGAGSSAAITITLRDRAGAVSGTITDTVLSGAQKTYDLSYEMQDSGQAPDLADDWLGSAVISASSDVAAVQTMHWGDYSAAYSAATVSGTMAYLPAGTRRVSGGTWLQYTGVVVQNMAVSTATIAVYWYDRDGNELAVFTDTIPALSAHGYNTRYVSTSDVPSAYKATLPAALGDDWNGSVIISSTNGAAVAAVANLQWTGDHPAGAGGAAYTSEAGGYDELFAPAAFRRVSGGTWLQYTGLVVQNVGSVECEFRVQWFDRGGDELLDYEDSLAAGIAHGYNTRFAWPGSDFPASVNPEDLGDSFRGSVYVSAPECELVGIHNTVWPAWTDSTTYNMFGR